MEQLSRRDFIKLIQASALAAVAMAAGCAPEAAQAPAAPTARPVTNEPQTWIKSVCRFCGTGCGVMLGVQNGKLVALRGDMEHPTTKGMVCAKALFLPKIVNSPDRLTTPLIRKNGRLVEAGWEEAMTLVADKFADTITRNGPDSVAYYGSGQALAEESYLANRLFKGGIGTNNVEGNPRLCMASAVGGYTTTFGKDEPMGSYDDIDHAQVFFIVGSNLAEAHPVIFDRLLERKKTGQGVQIILLDPRKNPVRRVADIHLAPIPGYDLAIFHAMAHIIIKEGLHNPDFIAKHVIFQKMVEDKATDVSFEDYVKFLEDFTPEKAAEIAGVPAGTIKVAARMFAKGPTMSLWTMGLNQRTTGVWANNLVHNLHLLTGHIGKPGATSFSLTGQPNACGGVRDTGSLSHLLPYGRVVTKEEHRAAIEQLWSAPPGIIKDKPGLNTIEMFKALAEDKIQVILILTTNPGHSLPNATVYREAMAKERPNKPLVVVIDAYPTRTTELADVVLPAAMWGEKEGVFGQSERRYQLMPQVLNAPGEARSDFDILLDLARRLEERGVVPAGYISGKFQTTADVWDEMRQASVQTPYNFFGMTRQRLRNERGLRWPIPSEDHPGTSRRFVKGEDPLLDTGAFADDTLAAGELKFYTGANNKAIIWLRPAKPPAEPVDAEYPYILSTGRVLEHWHTGTMTMKASELRRAQPEAFVEVNPFDADQLGVKTGDMLRIISRRGEAVIKVRVIDTPRAGMVFVPFHWADDNSLINRVTIDAYDPASKQPEFKVCAVKLAKAEGSV